MTEHEKTADYLVEQWIAGAGVEDAKRAVATALSRTEKATLRRAAEVADTYDAPGASLETRFSRLDAAAEIAQSLRALADAPE